MLRTNEYHNRSRRDRILRETADSPWQGTKAPHQDHHGGSKCKTLEQQREPISHEYMSRAHAFTHAPPFHARVLDPGRQTFFYNTKQNIYLYISKKKSNNYHSIHTHTHSLTVSPHDWVQRPTTNTQTSYDVYTSVRTRPMTQFNSQSTRLVVKSHDEHPNVYDVYTSVRTRPTMQFNSRSTRLVVTPHDEHPNVLQRIHKCSATYTNLPM